MILYFGDIKITANKSPEQKFTNHVGRKWTKGNILIDGEKYEFTFDIRFGRSIYFVYNGRWHTIKTESDYCDAIKYSFNPLLSTLEFTTSKSMAKVSSNKHRNIKLLN